ncbi:MAG: undecaprenyl-diphosphate phosphatase, partial [Vicinamibacterales bacterium]
VLGIVQGLTEFLPVSSSAHLILGRAFFGWDAGALGLAFDVACHLGTLLAVIAFFRAELLQMAAAVPRALAASDPTARLIRLIILGTLPILVAGVLYTDAVETALRTPLVAAVTLVAGGALMLVAERVGTGAGTEESLRPAGALAIGVGQAAALVPGLSRSGTTISIGLFLGLRRDAAARFTFLLSIPAILAAAAKEGLELADVGLTADAAALFGVGMIVSGVVGYLTIRFFLRYLAGHRLDAFAYYRFALAAMTFIWLGTRD